MFSKLKNLVWHHDTHKKYLLYALIFLVGMVISYGIFNIPASSYRSFMSMEEEAEMHRAGEEFRGMEEPGRGEINPEIFREGNVTKNCNKNNCDVISKLNDLQKQLGDTSSTLGKGITSIDNSGSLHLMQQIKGQNGQFGYSSWTLEALAKHNSNINMSILSAMNNKLGQSSWTLKALAKHNSDMNQNLNSMLYNKLGKSSWTLEALAQKIQNKCK